MAVLTAPVTAAPASRPNRLTTRNYLAYAAGDAANNLSFTMAGMFLILYYTNVVGIEGAAIGTMFLIVRFFDALTDLVAGRLVDAKKPGKLGKFRPFIAWFALPLLLSSMAIYSAKTFFPDISTGQALFYMYASYIVMGIFYTLVNIAYGSMAPSITQVPVERGKLAVFRGYGAAVAVLALAFIIAPQIRANVNDPVALQRSLFLTTAAFVVVGSLLYLFMVVNTQERVVRDVPVVSLKESLRTLTTNKPLLWLSLGAVFFLTGQTAMSTLGSYFAIYVQQDAQFIAWNTLAQVAALFVVAPLVPLIVRTIGKRAGYVMTGSVTLLGAAILAFAPATDAPVVGLIGFFFTGIGVYGVNTLMWALEADTVEYGEWKTGNRTEGTTYAVFSFTRKMGQALGGFVGGWALTVVGFSAARASAGEAQAAGVPENIQLAIGGLIGAFALLSVLVMAFYPLTDAKFQEIVAEISARRVKAAKA